ncbi:TIGR03086 family metal-binding protein [Arthrobacter sp. H35-D1]|uniref:TIGR03086 family metal-binding protein n=1 Tax=Arthrobacter sp. H35-D1 TaxID=3046202 RepID=UPI0024BA962A|nr:TIGR03086 family metal-binding protein [Arthrobacter sp. H35-D1]MDJ0315204.1 TIGR03086 family metal-binding protein [Arthrobacter sp. H35-D1]
MHPHTVPNPLQLLESALNQCAEVIGAIPANQAEWATPCPEWNVQDLLHHLVVQDLHKYTIMARGHNVDPLAAEATVGADWSTRFSDGAIMLMRAWLSADLSAQVALPGGGEAPLRSRIGLQITEFTVHAWDLVRATGVPVVLDPALAEQSLAWAQRTLKPEHRNAERGIGPEVRVPLTADPYTRLAGWFGRSPYFRTGPWAASLR